MYPEVILYIQSLECIILPMKYLFIYSTVDQGSFQLPTFKQLYRESCSVQQHGTVHQINQPFLQRSINSTPKKLRFMTVNFLETVFLVIMFRALIPVWCITITYLTLLELFYESCQENHCDLKVASSQEKNENFAS